MTTSAFQGELAGRSTGTTVIGLRQPELMKCIIHIPSGENQHRIASILASIDAKISSNQKINDNLNDLYNDVQIIIPRIVIDELKMQQYSVLPKFTTPLGPQTKITLQAQKVKIFYFERGQSEALITCFREKISKNKSEFRNMPEDDPRFPKR